MGNKILLLLTCIICTCILESCNRSPKKEVAVYYREVAVTEEGDCINWEAYKTFIRLHKNNPKRADQELTKMEQELAMVIAKHDKKLKALIKKHDEIQANIAVYKPPK